MNSWTVFLAALLAFAATATAEKKVVCYFGSWAVYRPEPGKFAIEYIDPRLCTHMIYTFVGISTEGEVKVLDSWQDLPDNYGKDGFGRFNKLREISPTTKTLVAIGGWNEGSAKYSQVVSNDALRHKFVNNVVQFVKKHKFDGFDVDWEYPNQRGGVPADKENYVKLLAELRQAFDKEGLILSAAVGAAETSASKSYNIAEVAKHLHFINLMSYDFHGAWDKFTAINAPLYHAQRETGDQLKFNVNASIHYWLENGAPPEKLVVGVPFYGRGFTLADVSKSELGATTTGPSMAGPYTREAGMLGYNEICEMLAQGGWTVKRDDEQRVPYIIKGNQWVGYDDIQSVKEKAEYINSLNLGGAMLWSIETDDFHGKCGETYPLLKTLNRVLRKDVKIPEEPPVVQPPTSTPQPPTPTPNPPPPTGVCTKEGYVRDPKDCSKFYFCQNVNGQYQVTPFHCAAGLVFDPKTTSCNYKDLVPGC